MIAVPYIPGVALRISNSLLKLENCLSFFIFIGTTTKREPGQIDRAQSIICEGNNLANCDQIAFFSISTCEIRIKTQKSPE